LYSNDSNNKQFLNIEKNEVSLCQKLIIL